MMVNNYRLEIFNNACMPGAMSVQCHAHLDQDVGPALPYLNAALGGFEYVKAPPVGDLSGAGQAPDRARPQDCRQCPEKMRMRLAKSWSG